MTLRVRLALRVPAADVATYEAAICEKYGQKQPYTGIELERELRSFLDMDNLAAMESTVDTLVEAAGRRPTDCSQKNPLERATTDDATKVVNYRVHPDVRKPFMTFVHQHSDLGAGRMIGQIMQSYADGGANRRVLDKLERVADDAESLLAGLTKSEESVGFVKRNTIAICEQLGDQFSNEELEASIKDVAGIRSPTTIDQYRRDVIDRLNVEPHPHNTDLWIPPEADAFASDGIPRECRFPVDLLDHSERAQRVLFECGRQAAQHRDRHRITARTVRDEVLESEVTLRTARNIMQTAADKGPGYQFDTDRADDATLSVNLRTVRDTDSELMEKIIAYRDTQSLTNSP